jgi:hypothetical protein
VHTALAKSSLDVRWRGSGGNCVNETFNEDFAHHLSLVTRRSARQEVDPSVELALERHFQCSGDGDVKHLQQVSAMRGKNKDLDAEHLEDYCGE